MFKNFFLISKSQVSLFTTIVALMVLASIYIFIYIPDNEKAVQQQRFRALQNIDRNIHSKLENSAALLNNIINKYQYGSDNDKKAVEKYIANYPTNNFKITAVDSISFNRWSAAKDSLDSAYTVTVSENTQKISLLATKKNTHHGITSLQLGMEMTFQQFVRNLLPDNVFDQYIIFSNDKPVFESFPSGISVMKKDSLISNESGMISAAVISKNIGGTDYKIFLQPVQLTANTEWIIAGLLSKERYQGEKNKLPTAVVLLMVTILLIIVVTLPWVKLYLMGSKDRLTVADGISAIFISMLLMSLIFFSFFKYNQPYRESLVESKAAAVLSNGITAAFLKEINTAYHAVIAADSAMAADALLQKNDLININKPGISFSNGRNDTGLQHLNKLFENLDVNQVFWLDAKGNEKINWTAQNENAPHGNFIHRKYVSNILNNHAYQQSSNPANKYFLDQVVSWTSGAFTSLVSVGSKLGDSLAEVAAISFNMKSLDSVILPAGYVFAVTDREGKVLYHSDKSKNLNENILQEFSDRDYLQSYYEAKTPGNFTTRYFGKKYHVDVKPLPHLPYFMLLMTDTQYKETRDLEIYSFTISMLLLFFVFLVLQLILIFFSSARRSFFKKQLMDSSWVGPKKSSNKQYLFSAVFNCIILLLLCIAFVYSSFLEYIFIILAEVCLVPAFLNGVFAYKYYEEKRNVLQFKLTALACLGVFLIVVNISATRYLDAGSLLRFFIIEAATLGIMLLLLHYRNGFYQASAAIKNRVGLLARWSYIHSFSAMGLTRLLVTSGIPIIFFYYSSYNYEQHIGSRYKQVDFYNQIIARFGTGTLEKNIAGNTLPAGVYIDSFWISHIGFIDTAVLNNHHEDAFTEEQKDAVQSLKKFRLLFTDMSVKNDQFYLSHAADSSYLFTNLLNTDDSSKEYSSSYIHSAIPSRYIHLQSGKLGYVFPGLVRFESLAIGGAIFWILLISTLVVFFFILRNIIRKLFSLNLPDVDTWKALDEKILADASLNSLVFVIGLPGSGKKFHLLNRIKKGEILTNSGIPLQYNENDPGNSNVFIADLINIPDSKDEDMIEWNEYMKKVFDKKNKLIIVNHFEYNIQDNNTNRIKLNFLEKLMLQDYFKIVILSSIHPVAFLDSVMSQTSLPDQKSVPGEDLERWHVLLGHYRIIMLPLDLDDVPAEYNKTPVRLNALVKSAKNNTAISNAVIKVLHTSIQTSSNDDGVFSIESLLHLPFTLSVSAKGYVREDIIINSTDENITVRLEEAYHNWKDKIRAETRYTHFLKKMRQPSIEVTENLRAGNQLTRSDDLAFKLQVSAHYFYMYIWQSLTKEEKFLLYDLAEDNLVNSYDSYNLSLLLGKGLVVKQDGVLKLFNRGFRNFILTAIGNTEAAKIQNQIRDNGSWGRLKNPLMLVVFTLLAFLLTSQEESYSRLITYVAALGAGIPGVLKLFSFFEKPVDKIN